MNPSDARSLNVSARVSPLALADALRAMTALEIGCPRSASDAVGSLVELAAGALVSKARIVPCGNIAEAMSCLEIHGFRTDQLLQGSRRLRLALAGAELELEARPTASRTAEIIAALSTGEPT